MRDIYRYERKFILSNQTIPELENLLRNSKFNFKKNYPTRKVNSIYFDDYNASSVLENLDGNNFKNKVRLRWYGKKKLIRFPTKKNSTYEVMHSNLLKNNFKIACSFQDGKKLMTLIDRIKKLN